MRYAGIALLLGLVTVGLVGCNKPCASASDCPPPNVCAVGVCGSVACDVALFVRNPRTGECVALSGCALSDEQRTWQTCQDDPCAGLSENSCLAEGRCQPAYA